MDNNSSSYIRCIGKVCRVDTNIIKAAAKKTAHTILQPPGSRLCRSAVGTPEWPREKEDQSKKPRNHGPAPAGTVQDNFQGHTDSLEPFGTVRGTRNQCEMGHWPLSCRTVGGDVGAHARTCTPPPKVSYVRRLPLNRRPRIPGKRPQLKVWVQNSNSEVLVWRLKFQVLPHRSIVSADLERRRR